MRGHFVSRPRQTELTEKSAVIATRLILEGKSTTQVFRALGYRSSGRLMQWLADKTNLALMLRQNAHRYRESMGEKYKHTLRGKVAL